MKGLIFLLLAGFTSTACATSYPPISVEMPVKRVSTHAYYAQGAAGTATDNEGFISNAGFVITDEGVVVFDSLGTPSLGYALREKIRQLTDKPVTKVVVSHYHADHIYGLQVFADEGAEILAPKGAYDYLNSPASTERLEERRRSLSPWVNDQTRLVPPTRVIDGAYDFSLGGVDFHIDYLGKAHSDGDMTMYVAQDKVLFSGDIIFEGRIPFVGGADTKQWLDSLRGLQTTELAALVPGHGPAADQPAEAIARTVDYLAYLREVMGAAVDEMQDFASAYAAADWSRFENLPAFAAANRRNAYGVYLSMEAESMR